MRARHAVDRHVRRFRGRHRGRCDDRARWHGHLRRALRTASRTRRNRARDSSRCPDCSRSCRPLHAARGAACRPPYRDECEVLGRLGAAPAAEPATGPAWWPTRGPGSGRARQAGAVLGARVAAARIPDLERRRPRADAPGRSAAARARRRDRDRAHRRPARPRRLRRDGDGGTASRMLATLSASAIALSKRCCPTRRAAPGCSRRLGAQTVVAATVRAMQLLGRQFVLGRYDRRSDAASRATQRREQPRLRFSYDMLGEGARTEADAQRYLDAYADAHRARSPRAAPRRGRAGARRRHLDQAVGAASRATRTRSASG